MEELYLELEKKGFEVKRELSPEKMKEIWAKDDDYNNIRVDGYIKSKSRHVWETNFGKIPTDMAIHHKNGNKKDNRIENLELLTRKEHGFKHLKPNRKRIISLSGSIKVIKEK